MKKVPVQFTLNGEDIAEFIDSGTTLLAALRERIGTFSSKGGCHQGTCGACTVIVDGRLQLGCLTLAESCENRSVETLESLGDASHLHPLQEAFMTEFAAQCGYCTSGMILAAKALLDRNPDPNRAEVEEAIAGNICRCTGYQPIIAAILSAARKINGADTDRMTA